MYRSPNLEYRLEEDDLTNSFQKGENQIEQRFRNALDVLLTPDYYEGSCLGKYYTRIGKNGYSSIYVPQPILENQLQEDLVERKEDIVMFLVGYTGVGKTTLIRNFFRVFDRNITVTKNNLVVYVSFYSTAANVNEKDLTSVLRVAIQAIEKACTYVSGFKSYPERLMSYNEAFYKDLYLYIAQNNSSLAHEFDDFASDKKVRGMKTTGAEEQENGPQPDSGLHDPGQDKFEDVDFKSKLEESLKNL